MSEVERGQVLLSDGKLENPSIPVDQWLGFFRAPGDQVAHGGDVSFLVVPDKSFDSAMKLSLRLVAKTS